MAEISAMPLNMADVITSLEFLKQADEPSL